MKLLHKLSLTIVACSILAAPLSAQDEQPQPQREHRAVWMTPFLGSNWPSAAITEGNAESIKRALRTRFAAFKKQNVNVVYYHVRSMCDAMYNSAYEPWSSSASGKRGVAPAFDPFEFLVQTAHEYGLEAYAWVNPYRYCGQTSGYGTANANDYENSHPDWLIRQTKESILNPGLPQVRQRIADVCADITSKYDIDGIVFDDYFYSNPTPLSLDADLFNAYKANGGKITDQYEWRRQNVNEMVKLCGETIHALKPHVVFGIAPAGICSPPDCQNKYGFPGPSIGSDWQYNSIASEPMNWVANHYVDFIGPQIYWPNMYNVLESWWINAAQAYNRQVYTAISISSAEDWGHAEFARELIYARKNSLPNTAGVSFFQYADFVNKRENCTGKMQSLADNIHDLACPQKALTPLRPWQNVHAPAMVSSLTISGNTLSWAKPASGDYRYTVYAIPAEITDQQFAMQKEYLDGIVYDNTYTIPDDKASGYRWAVACYDRFGNEYSPVLAGASATTIAPATLTYPADNGFATSIFTFSWIGQGNRFIVELARDSEFNDIVGWIETGEHKANATDLGTFENGKTYYWRVRSQALNAPEVVSAAASFTSRPMTVTSPTVDQAGLEVTPTITWDNAADGAQYLVEIANNLAITDVVYSTTTTNTNISVPDYVLSTGRKYFVRVTATMGDVSVSTDAVGFSTANVSDYAAPIIGYPAEDGAKLYSNESIVVDRVSGAYSTVIYISASNSFPARSSFQQTLTNYETKSTPLGEIKVSSKLLEDGKTYYVRARRGYNLTTSTSVQYTDYSPVFSFVYSSEAGISDVFVDESTVIPVYYNLQGVRVDADNLKPGIYIKRQGNKTTKVYIR